MRAIAKCPKCKKIIEENCEACIEDGTSLHNCGGELKTVKVKYKKFAETEKELEIK